MSQGDNIAPVPGTRRVRRVEENIGADEVHLSDDQLARLSALPPAAADTHKEADMRMMER